MAKSVYAYTFFKLNEHNICGYFALFFFKWKKQNHMFSILSVPEQLYVSFVVPISSEQNLQTRLYPLSCTTFETTNDI